MQNSPIAKVMPVVMKPPEHHERKRALVLIIDKSGSMGRNDKLELRQGRRDDRHQDAERRRSDRGDRLRLATVRGGSAGDRSRRRRPYFDELIDRLKAHGTTFLLPALEEAERDARASGAAIKHVVILTDGETGGTAAMYYDLVSIMHRDGGATISTIAVGREANLPLLESISKYGGGGFYQTDSPDNLPRTLSRRRAPARRRHHDGRERFRAV